MTADNGLNWGVAKLPNVNPDDKGGACIGGASLAMFNNGDDTKANAAWEFIKYAASAQTQSTWSQATGYLPINLGTKELDEYKAFVEESPAVKVALEQFESSNPMVQEPVMMMQGSIDSVIKDASTYLCEGNMNAEEATNYVIEECNKLFEEYTVLTSRGKAVKYGKTAGTDREIHENVFPGSVIFKRRDRRETVKLSTSTNIYFNRPDHTKAKIEDSVRLCGEAGYRVMDMNFYDCTSFKLPFVTDEWESWIYGIRDIAQQFQMEFSQAHANFYNFCDPYAKDKEFLDRMVLRSIDCAKNIGSKMAGNPCRNGF